MMNKELKKEAMEEATIKPFSNDVYHNGLIVERVVTLLNKYIDKAVLAQKKKDAEIARKHFQPKDKDNLHELRQVEAGGIISNAILNNQD